MIGGGGGTECCTGAGALWEDSSLESLGGESMAGLTLNLRCAESIFTLDRVTMPLVISLTTHCPFLIAHLLSPTDLPPSVYLFSHSFTLFFVSSCGVPSRFLLQLKSKWLWVFHLALKQAAPVFIFPSSTFRVSSVFLSLSLSSSSPDSLLALAPLNVSFSVV